MMWALVVGQRLGTLRLNMADNDISLNSAMETIREMQARIEGMESERNTIDQRIIELSDGLAETSEMIKAHEQDNNSHFAGSNIGTPLSDVPGYQVDEISMPPVTQASASITGGSFQSLGTASGQVRFTNRDHHTPGYLTADSDAGTITTLINGKWGVLLRGRLRISGNNISVGGFMSEASVRAGATPLPVGIKISHSNNLYRQLGNTWVKTDIEGNGITVSANAGTIFTVNAATGSALDSSDGITDCVLSVFYVAP